MTLTSWPSGVSAPSVSDLRIIPTESVKIRRLESGRVEVRRFGSGAPYRFEGSIEMSQTEYETFCQWYEGDHELGTVWSEADWLSTIGFSSDTYVVRVIVLPKAARHNGHRATVSFNLLVQDRAKVSEA